MIKHSKNSVKFIFAKATDKLVLEKAVMHQTSSNRLVSKKKVKFSHTRYRALGPELIPVYRQSARR